MPDLSDPLHFVAWMLRHLDNLGPPIAAAVGVIAWLVKKAGDRRAANTRALPSFVATAEPELRPVPAGVDVVSAQPAMPPLRRGPVPMPRPGPAAPPAAEPSLPARGITSFARRLGEPVLLRDAIVAAEIFAPPPGLR